ncbi:hypothetical protein B0H17DRAFT_917879 [Mycena rosella]|uniref:RNA ligase domain-containing protein n=1 Tax=Mycena rosella TaxID=1033263 RepID=A0AAD7MAB0_MYCRO|nr:hypothetical protein B0H17DRAFT_917879 [Mycena rosella]
MAHIAYPSTQNFKNFKADYIRALERPQDGDSDVSDPAPGKRPPARATFFGTVKLHGTNATVVFRDGNKADPQIQSRSWVIENSKKDNLGTFALLSAAPLSALVDQILAARGQGSQFEEIYICGEIAGRGVQKGVAIVALQRFFAIFNIRIDGRWVDMRRYKSCSLPQHRIYNVAQYKTFEVDIDFRASTAAVHDLMTQYTAEVFEECPFGAAFVDDTGKQVTGAGEGIVWTMVRTPDMSSEDFDDTILCNFKTKGEKFTATTSAKEPQKYVNPELADATAQFVDYALAERRFEQGIEYLEGEQAREGKPIDGYDVKLTGAFIKWVVEDTVKEERNEMERLGVPEREAKKELGARAKEWYARRCREIVDALTAG